MKRQRFDDTELGIQPVEFTVSKTAVKAIVYLAEFSLCTNVHNDRLMDLEYTLSCRLHK